MVATLIKKIFNINKEKEITIYKKEDLPLHEYIVEYYESFRFAEYKFGDVVLKVKIFSYDYAEKNWSGSLWTVDVSFVKNPIGNSMRHSTKTGEHHFDSKVELESLLRKFGQLIPVTK